MNSHSKYSTSDDTKGPSHVVEVTVRKGEKSSKQSAHGPGDRGAVYQFHPKTFLGRLVATVVTIALLLGVVLFSLALFSILVIAILVVIGYALWRTHRATERSGTVIDIERDGR